MSLRQLKQKIAEQKAAGTGGLPVPSEGVGVMRKNTPVQLGVGRPPAPPTPQQAPQQPAQQAPQQPAQQPQAYAPPNPAPMRPVPPPAPTQPPQERSQVMVQPMQQAYGGTPQQPPMRRPMPPGMVAPPPPPAPTTTTQDMQRSADDMAYDLVMGLRNAILEDQKPAPTQHGGVPQPPKSEPSGRPLPKMTDAQAEALLKGGRNALNLPIPDGYVAIGKNDVEALMWLKAEIILHKIMAFDYETNGDPDDDTTDPQDHVLVGVSCTYRVGFAAYLPIAHDNYGANWDLEWLKANFLKVLLEDPEVYLIAHNIKAEYQWSLIIGIDLFPKAMLHKVMDTMLMVKALCLSENTQQVGDKWEVVIGLKPATKALLASDDGMVHGILHVDDIKSFTETVGRVHWKEPIPGEFYKSSGKNGKKGDPKMRECSRSRTFNELPVDKATTDYGASDSDWALGIFYKLVDLCTSEGIMETLYELDIPRMMVLAEYELAGWHVSRDRLLALQTVAQKALMGDPDSTTEEGRRGLESLLTTELMALVPNARIVIDPETGRETVEVPTGRYPMGQARMKGMREKQDVFLEIKTTKPMNWGSPQHKQWLFYHVLRFPLAGVDRSKATGLPTTDGETIDRFIETYEGDSKFMELLKEKAQYDKINSTYVEGMLPYCRKDTDRLHTALKLVSTWRLSSGKPNLQNIPRPENDPMGIRGVFVAPFLPNTGVIHLPEKKILLPDKSPAIAPPQIITPDQLNPWTAKTWHFIIERKLSGYTFYIGSDYSQIELKVLAWFANELAMIETLAHGGDLHSKVAKDVFKLACTVDEVKELFKPHRYRAKKVNFGLVYGMTEFGLSSDPKMGMNKDQAKQFIDDYMKTYPGVRAYADEQIAFARKYGYVMTMFNHRRPVPHINDPNYWIRQKAENVCMNTPIQGSAADIIALAMVNIRKEQHLAPYLSMHMQIHDELQGQSPVEHAVQSAVFMKQVMERPIPGFSEIMPIVSEPAIGATWDTALDLKFEPNGTPYVKPKAAKKEATDVTYDMIAPYENMYRLAGIKIA